MYYQFDSEGNCVSTCTGAVEPMDGIVSVEYPQEYSDIDNVKLINGRLYHLEGDADGTTISG